MKGLLRRWAERTADGYAKKLFDPRGTYTHETVPRRDKTAFNMVRAAQTAYSLRDAWHGSYDTVLRSCFLRRHPLAPDEIGVVCQRGLGDVYIVSALAHEIKASLGARSISLFVMPRYAFIPAIFPSVDKIIGIPAAINIYKLGSYQLAKGSLFYGHFPEMSLLNFAGRNGVNFLDCYKTLFHLPEDCSLQAPALPGETELEEAGQLLSKLNAPPGRTVILCPDTVSVALSGDSTPKEFWNTVSSELGRAGFKVLTNAGPQSWQVEGTEMIDIPLRLFRAVALTAGHVTANRSGICDLISDLDIKLVVLYPKINFFGGPVIKGTSLRKMNLSQSALEMEIDLNDVDGLTRSITSYLGT
jgi:hypothetical protein